MAEQQNNPLTWTVFPSELGWIAAVGRDGLLLDLVFGYATPADARRAALKRCEADAAEGDWAPKLFKRLQTFAAGRYDDFLDVALDDSHLSPFARRVIKHCRKIPLGETLSYGRLAARAGSPGAARAVGNIMAANRVALIVPCHRVVGSDGRLRGYSMSSGLTTKQHLLDLEASLRFDAMDVRHLPVDTWV